MTLQVIWMRHGTCHDGLCRPDAHARPDSPLTILGAIEAETTAHRLRHAGWRRPSLVIASPLPRATNTARLVANALGIPAAPPHDVFAEWRAPHCVLGLGRSRYPPAYREWQHQRTTDPDTALPGGESLRALCTRAADADHHAWNLADREQSPVLVISHRVMIGCIAAHALGYRDPVELFNYARRFHLGPAQTWIRDRRPEGPP